ncbi:MAG TPA: DNA-binding protein [Syntrophomonas sp.]|nr:DNA-binding protein [Syntrophomonas sp.]
MQYMKYDDIYLLSLDRGEEVIQSIKDFCRKQKITLGLIHGIGASNQISVGLFETAAMQYHTMELTGDHEITNLSGNISTKDGNVYLHIHATLVDAKFKATGGHLNSAVISGACELFIQALDGEGNRIYDSELGLNVFQLNK